jgi:hypothetical protein
MSSNGEQVPYDLVDGKEALCLRSRSEASHVALASPRRLVGDFDPVVGVAGGVMHNRRHEGPLEQASKEPGRPRGGPGGAGSRMSITSPSWSTERQEVLALPPNGHEEFVQVPDVDHGAGAMAEQARVGECRRSRTTGGWIRTSMPRCASRSSTSRRLNVKR